MSSALAHAALAIAAAGFDGLWEGALIAGAVWLALRCLPQLGAATRYAIWLCALVGLVVIPVLTVGLAGQPSAPALGAAAPGVPTSVSIAPSSSHDAPILQPHAERPRTAPQRIREPRSVAAKPAPDVSAARIAPVAAGKVRIAIPQGLALAAALLWLLLACSNGLRLLVDVRAIAALRRDARLWSTAYDYPVFLSDRVQVPIAVGFRHAAIVLPAPLVDRLHADAVHTVIVHEVAHVHRHDVWTNALARIAVALAVLNPAAWFVMRRLSVEREIACDDWVVARTGAGDAFARTLLDMASRAGARAPLAAPSAIGSRHSIVVRIERLLDSRPRRLRLSPSALGGSLVLLAIFALVVQSVSPVLAYAPNPGTPASRSAAVQVAGTCAVPDRDVRLTTFLGLTLRPKRAGMPFPAAGLALPDARKLIDRFGAANVATFDLTVDAAGRPSKVLVQSAPRYPGMVEHVTRIAMAGTYEPARRGCIPVASTVRTALHFGTPIANAYSIVAPAYPSGWSARFTSACKVPTLQHTGVPAFPSAMQNMSVEASYRTSVRVHVDAAGAVTSAAVVTPSGEPDLDDALLAAARRTTYPLTESTGFKQVRPSGAPLDWNAAHGSATYVGCKPSPTEYVWNTTFAKVVPIGVLGTDSIVMIR